MPRRCPAAATLLFVVLSACAPGAARNDSVSTRIPSASARPGAALINLSGLVWPSLAELGADATISATLPLTAFGGALRTPFATDLLRSADATRYWLDWRIDPARRQIDATQRVRYVNRAAAPLEDIMLRLYPGTRYMGGALSLDKVALDDPEFGERVVAPTQSGSPRDSVMRVPLPTPLAPGQAVTLTLAYRVTARPNPEGGYRTFGEINGVLALPSAYPMIPPRDAHGAWSLPPVPDFGDVVYSESALFLARIRIPARLQAAVTGVCERSAEEAGAVLLTCVAGPVRDFAVHLSETYRHSETAVPSAFGEPIRLRAYWQAQHEKSGRQMMAHAADALAFFETRFGPYPYRELTVFESTTPVGGIEYPMASGVTPQPGDEMYFEWLTIHEVAHQWWYGLVGSDPTREAWLDEALTQYSTLLLIEAKDGLEAARQRRQRFFVDRAAGELRERGPMVIARPSAAFPRLAYAPAVYGRAPMFFEDVRVSVGDERFFAWLRRYLAAKRYGLASAEDLLYAADAEQIGGQVRDAHRRWILTPQGRVRQTGPL